MAGVGTPPQVSEVLACSFDRWYQSFHDVTFRSVVISLPEPFVQYLLADGVRLPKQLDDGKGSDNSWGDGGSDSDEEAELHQCSGLQDVLDAIREAIRELGGQVLPKLNWSAPRDASWVLGTLQCYTVQDVLTLLKASDFVAHDLCHSFDDCVDKDSLSPPRPDPCCLVLREWRSINEANEFRCFVREEQLCAISQRNCSVFFPHLVDPEFQQAVTEKLSEFYANRVQGKFPLERFAFDVLLGKPPKHRVRLVDFSPWAPSTDPLMFTWEELAELPTPGQGGCPAELRVIQREGEGRARVENYHSIPLEVAELGATSVEEMESLCRRAEMNLRP